MVIELGFSPVGVVIVMYGSLCVSSLSHDTQSIVMATAANKVKCLFMVEVVKRLLKRVKGFSSGGR